MRFVVVKVLAAVALAAVAYYSFRFFAALYDIPYEYVDVAKAFIIAGAGVTVANLIGNAIISHLRPTLRERAYAVGNTIKVIGALFALIIALTTTRIGTEVALLGGAVTGLVLGLALQPVLGNLFAGLFILASRYVTVGDTVRIVSPQVPYQAALWPLYKYFSPDYVAPGYKGRVAEVGLFYTTLILDTGQELKVPNMVLLNAGVVDFTPQWSEKMTVVIRLELPLSIIDIETLEEEVRSVLHGFEVSAVDFTEQSDKDFVIIRVKIKVSMEEDWRRAKSEALKRLLKYREERLVRHFSKYLCMTRGVMCDKYLSSLSSQ